MREAAEAANDLTASAPTSSPSRLRGMWERHGDKALERLLAPQEIRDFAGRRQGALSGQALCRQGGLQQGAGYRRSSAGTCRRLPSATTNWASHQAGLSRSTRRNDQKKNWLEGPLSISDEADYAIAYVILEHA
jgi:holo-[acyl-carrier protein] synthase